MAKAVLRGHVNDLLSQPKVLARENLAMVRKLFLLHNEMDLNIQGHDSAVSVVICGCVQFPVFASIRLRMRGNDRKRKRLLRIMRFRIVNISKLLAMTKRQYITEEIV